MVFGLVSASHRREIPLFLCVEVQEEGARPAWEVMGFLSDPFGKKYAEHYQI